MLMKRDIITLLILLAPVLMMAQPAGPPNPTPLGFTEILLAGGAALGARKAYLKKKNEN